MKNIFSAIIVATLIAITASPALGYGITHTIFGNPIPADRLGWFNTNAPLVSTGGGPGVRTPGEEPTEPTEPVPPRGPVTGEPPVRGTVPPVVRGTVPPVVRGTVPPVVRGTVPPVVRGTTPATPGNTR